MSHSPPHLLFLCARNQWRSPTAEEIYRRDPRCEVRSAGLSSNARRRVTAKDLVWADQVLVMEKEHRSRLRQQFPQESAEVEILVLDIPDDYRYLDPELISMLRDQVEAVLQEGETL